MFFKYFHFNHKTLFIIDICLGNPLAARKDIQATSISDRKLGAVIYLHCADGFEKKTADAPLDLVCRKNEGKMEWAPCGSCLGIYCCIMILL